MTTSSMTALLLRASEDYTVLSARYICDEDGFAFFDIQDGHGSLVAEVALWREDDGLETTEGWCELGMWAQAAIRGGLDRRAILDAIFKACLAAGDAEARTITAEVGYLHDDEIVVEVLIGGQRAGRVRASRCRDHRHPEGGLAVSVEDAQAICRDHASVSVEEIERAASEAFRAAWADPQHPTPAWVLREAVDSYADLIGEDITDDDIRELGFEGALADYHAYSNSMREQQPWTVIYSAAEVAAMAEWRAAL